MIFDYKQSLVNYIIDLLKTGPVKITRLVALIQAQRPKTSKQGIYRILRLLKNQEVLVVHQGETSLNIRWLNRLNDFLETAKYYYFQKEFGVGNFTNLIEGEKIEYHFKSLALTDAFWNHVLYLLLEITSPNEYWFGYNPHDWFFLAREDEELALLKYITQNKKRLYLLTAGNKTPMDVIIAKKIAKDNGQYMMLDKPLFANPAYYFNIIGSFLIEVYFDKNITSLTEEWYRKVEKISEEEVKNLQSIVQMKGKVRFVISRKTKKTEKLKKALSKNFYFPKN